MTAFQQDNRRSNLAARVLFETAQQLFLEGKHRESIEVFTEFMAVRGEVGIALLSRGVAYLKTGKTDTAIEDFGKVIENDHQNVRAYFYRGMALMAKKEFERAIDDFDSTIDLKPDHGAAFFARGSAYAQLGNEYEGARNIKTAITFSESNIQGFTDTFGLFRTQFSKAMAIMEDKEKAQSMTLSEDDIRTVKKWLDERDQ